jgi:hypothetical protein
VTYPGGKVLPIDMEAVDAGYHTDAAQAFARGGRTAWRSSAAMAGTGPSWAAAKRSASPSKGKRAGQASKRADDRAYIVGTFGAKATWYGFLRSTLAYAKAIVEEGTGTAKPVGLCHFSRDTTDEWFDMATPKRSSRRSSTVIRSGSGSRCRAAKTTIWTAGSTTWRRPKSCCWTR